MLFHLGKTTTIFRPSAAESIIAEQMSGYRLTRCLSVCYRKTCCISRNSCMSNICNRASTSTISVFEHPSPSLETCSLLCQPRQCEMNLGICNVHLIHYGDGEGKTLRDFPLIRSLRSPCSGPIPQ